MASEQITLGCFRDLFLGLTKDWTWEVEGFLDTQGWVHPIDSDTKVLSTVFERLASPVIRSIARRFEYEVELANQTTYPDFTLTSVRSDHRIAIDIKSTYVRGEMGLTLGGYNSFLRNGTKNILYPYNSYAAHWIVGFVYSQLEPHKAYDLENMPKPAEIRCPYNMKAVFVRAKHEVCGLRAGSGNTKNIGSVRVKRPHEFQTITGPFMQFAEAEAACDHYWRNYEQYVDEIATVADLVRHPDFRRFRVLK